MSQNIGRIKRYYRRLQELPLLDTWAQLVQTRPWVVIIATLVFVGATLPLSKQPRQCRTEPAQPTALQQPPPVEPTRVTRLKMSCGLTHRLVPFGCQVVLHAATSVWTELRAL